VQVRIGISDVGVISNMRDIRMGHVTIQAHGKGVHCLDVWWVPHVVQTYVAE